MTPQAGDFWLADIPFTDGSASNVRPVLVLWLDGQDAVVAAVTSAAPRSPSDVASSSPSSSAGPARSHRGCPKSQDDLGCPRQAPILTEAPSPRLAPRSGDYSLLPTASISRSTDSTDTDPRSSSSTRADSTVGVGGACASPSTSRASAA